MKRVQVYLDDDLWNVLQLRARATGTTIAELLRRAVREKFPGSIEERKNAMHAVVGIWKDRRDIKTPASYVRSLRAASKRKRPGQL